MTDINELRRLAQAATQHVGRACNYQDAHSPREGHVDFENADLFIASERPAEDAAFYAAANPAAVSELLDRLEAAEKERDDVARQLVQSEQGKRKISEECDTLRNEIAYVKEVEFPRKAQAVADAWKGKCKRLEVERDELRAKVEQMERQEPVARTVGGVTEWVSNGDGTYSLGGCLEAVAPLPDDAQLYALPGAQNVPSVPEGFALVNAAHFLAVLDREDWRTAKNRAELRAMLAAAPEAKP